MQARVIIRAENASRVIGVALTAEAHEGFCKRLDEYEIPYRVIEGPAFVDFDTTRTLFKVHLVPSQRFWMAERVENPLILAGRAEKDFGWVRDKRGWFVWYIWARTEDNAKTLARALDAQRVAEMHAVGQEAQRAAEATEKDADAGEEEGA